MEATEALRNGLRSHATSSGPSLAREFDSLFERHAPVIYRLCAHRTGELDLAQDLTSVTFLEAWRRRDRMPADADVLPWLMGIAINVTRNASRSRRRHAAALARLPRLPHEPDHAELIADRDAAAKLLAAATKALETLPRNERDVITLVCWEQLTYEQAAAALGIAVGTVRSRLSRGRRRLTAIVANDKETP